MTDQARPPLELFKALVEAVGALTVVDKGREADAGKYRYAYADLGDIVKATRPALAAKGIVALTPVHEHGDRLAVTVTLYHSSGEVLEFPPLPFPYGPDAQATGSMITYYRRYALLAALGMAAGEANPLQDPGDDDGAAGQPRTPGFRTSVVDAVAKLTEDERAELRAWLASEQLPARPIDMDEAQCERVLEWIMSVDDPQYGP